MNYHEILSFGIVYFLLHWPTSSGQLHLRSQDEILALRNFGDNCSDSSGEVCDIKESFACINQTCQCVDQTTMIYDPSRGLCVGRAGQRCATHLSEASVPHNKRSLCVMYSSCELNEIDNNKNNTCKCWSSFYMDSESGLCARRKGYLQKCEQHEHCNSRKGFICNLDLGVCACDTSVSVYNMDTERCAGLPNYECTNIYRECTENHKCKAGICKCKFKEVETANGTVLCDPVMHKYGKPCGRFRGDCGDEIKNNLRCLDGKCRCKNPDYQIYDYERRVCVSKVGGPCSIDDFQQDTFRNGTSNSKFNPLNFPVVQCIPYAECSPHKHSHNHSLGTSRKLGVCECGESYIETKKGLCSLPYGADCDTSSKNKTDQCAEPLKCVSNQCACQNEMDVYDKELRKCAKSVKSLCWTDSSCVKNAECKKRNKNLPGRCKCRAKFRATTIGSCV